MSRAARSIAGRPATEWPADEPRRIPSTGVIFVHGIGTQPPRETLLNWANPIVEMLAEWRREYDERIDSDRTIGEDPVDSAGIERADGWDERAWVRVAIPEIDDDHPARTWLLTE